MLEEKNNVPVVYPLKRMLYSRKILLLMLSLIITLLGEVGLPETIVANFNELAIAIIIAWTAKDVATNFRNGK